ncbi:hypothetical protein PCASD_06324 [Puccinia coronata f. sp. avenae]|uniref:Uncharacterized protein n=1 Tax=Puccinia coronata f. sp. avenae TaxID=200324 RepID=A0A2N5V8Z9_9BASI|nr:hypothetical protein PCASD_06324 [Puccinia coronata f. sp. avenae]
MSLQRTPPTRPANATTPRSTKDCSPNSPENTAIPPSRMPLHQQDHCVDGRQLPPRAHSIDSGNYGNSGFVNVDNSHRRTRVNRPLHQESPGFAAPPPPPPPPPHNRSHFHGGPPAPPPPPGGPISEAEDQARIKAEKDLSGLVDGAVNHVKSLGILRSDGSNFREWFCAIEMISQDILEDRHYYQVPCVRPILEKMAKRILLRVVDPTLADELWTQPHVFAMMSSLRSRFTTFSEAHMI